MTLDIFLVHLYAFQHALQEDILLLTQILTEMKFKPFVGMFSAIE
jgi:hypothetical protein